MSTTVITSGRHGRSWRKGMFSVAKAATKKVPENVKNYVKKVTKESADTRYQITVQPGTAIDYNGLVVYMHGQMPQGDDNAMRTANSIKPTHLECKLALAFASTDSFNAIRVVIFQYMVDSSVSAPLTTGPVDQTQLAFLGQAWAPYAFADPNQKDDYHIVYDKIHLVGGANAATAGGLNQMQCIKISLKKLKKLLYPVAANQSAVGELWMAVYSDSAAVSHPSFEFSSKLTYVA